MFRFRRTFLTGSIAFARNRDKLIVPLFVGAMACLLAGCTTSFHPEEQASRDDSFRMGSSNLELERGLLGGIKLRDPDGGSEYLKNFLPDQSSREQFFPIGVWLESIVDPGDLKTDSDVGLNTYVDLTTNSDLDLLSGTDSLLLTVMMVVGLRSGVTHLLTGTPLGLPLV